MANIKNENESRVKGRGGAPALMHRSAAVEAVPSPEKGGEWTHRASRSVSAVARTPVSWSARYALGKVGVLSKQLNQLLTTDNIWMYSSTRIDEGRPHGPRVWLQWWKLHWLASAACSCIFFSLPPGCLAYGAFVAAVAAMVSVLPWACLGCSFFVFCFSFFAFVY